LPWHGFMLDYLASPTTLLHDPVCNGGEKCIQDTSYFQLSTYSNKPSLQIPSAQRLQPKQLVGENSTPKRNARAVRVAFEAISWAKRNFQPSEPNR